MKGHVAGLTDGSRCRKLHFELEILVSVNEVMMQEVMKTYSNVSTFSEVTLNFAGLRERQWQIKERGRVTSQQLYRL